AKAGRGQTVVRRPEDLFTALRQINPPDIARCGLVLETQLEDVSTYSVGQVRLHGLTLSYVGTQRLTRDNRGEEVYGGSELTFARGDYDDLKKLDLPETFRTAIQL